MPYQPDLLSPSSIPLPTLGPTAQAAALNGGTPIDHEKFSVIFNEQRGLAILSAHNIDGGSMIEEGTIDRHNFVLDPDVASPLQINNKRGYLNNPWDRGHLARRRSLHWGDVNEATEADRQSSFWTNIAPQHETLHDTAWGDIEDFMLSYTTQNEQRAAVFTGPVLTDEDPEHVNTPGQPPIRIPAGFWKVIAIHVSGLLRAAAFVVWQRDFDRPTPITFQPFLEQVRLTTIEFLVGIRFPELLRVADPLEFGAGPAGPLAGPAAAPQPRRSPIIRSASDIYLN